MEKHFITLKNIDNLNIFTSTSNVLRESIRPNEVFGHCRYGGLAIFHIPFRDHGLTLASEPSSYIHTLLSTAAGSELGTRIVADIGEMDELRKTTKFRKPWQ